MNSVFYRVRDQIKAHMDAVFTEEVLHEAYDEETPAPVISIGVMEDTPFQVFLEEVPVSDYSERPTTCNPIETQWEQRIHVIAMGKDLDDAGRVATNYIDALFQIFIVDKSLGRLVYNSIPAVIGAEEFRSTTGDYYVEAVMTVRMKANVPNNPVVQKAVMLHE